MGLFRLTVLVGLLAVCSTCEASENDHSEWSYSEQANWTCDATKLRQSPIDIQTSQAKYMKDWKLDFIDYNQEVAFQVKNTHHSVAMIPVCNVSKPTIKVSWVPGENEFELREIHFHWGDGINKGSEHEVNDRKAAAEMHMVHYKKGIDTDKIGTTENSVVVIGVFIESDKLEHNKLESLVHSATKVNGSDEESYADKPEYLINLLPDEKSSFYTYNGSLTTPPCYEVVTWVIMSQPVYLCQDNLIELARTQKSNSNGLVASIGPNFREIQPLLDRPVYSSHNTSTSITLKGMHKKLSTMRFKKVFDKYADTFKKFETQVRTAARKIALRLHLKRRESS